MLPDLHAYMIFIPKLYSRRRCEVDCMSAGKLGEVWQRVGQLQTVCLAKAASSQKASKSGTLSRAALRESLKWAAAHTPRQPSVQVMI